MATALEVGNILEVVFRSRSQRQYAVNVRHYRVEVVGVPPLLDTDAAAHISNLIGPLLRAAMTNQATYLNTSVQVLNPVRLDPVFSNVQSGVGDYMSDLIPTQACGLIRFNTGLAGRANRGRMYVPFAAEGANDTDGSPNDQYLLDIGAIGNALDDTQTIAFGGRTGTLAPIIFHRETFLYTRITSYSVIDAWATQRRRSQVNRSDF